MKTCPICFHENPDDARSCKSCGSSFDHQQAKTRLFDPQKITIEKNILIDKRYLVVRRLGYGGMGAVYLVDDQALEEQYALKMIHRELVESKETLQRFRAEVATSRRLMHPAIIRVFDFGSWGSQWYFTMEHLEGATLTRILAERKGSLPPLGPAEIRKIMLPLLDALAYAHKTTIHRDIKPDNIMVTGKLPDIEVKLLDFGIARTMSLSRMTQTSQGLGTTRYMPPEQEDNPHDIDHRADLYSLGMVLYELLTGRQAIGRFKLPSQLIGPAYASFDDIVDTALAHDREDRYKNARAMEQALIVALDNCKKDPQPKERTAHEPAEKYPGKEEDNKQKKAGDTYTDPTTGMEFVYVPGGCYQMGDTFGDGYDDEQPVHEVCVDGFYMGKYPVTQEEYTQIMGTNPSGFTGNDRLPVECVSWDDAQEFIKLLNKKSGTGYRLPTEAEWEYAAREGGKKVRFGTGKDTIGPDEANFDARSRYKKSYSRTGKYRKQTTPVDNFAPNSLGLHDMSGNVYEWCSDWYGEDYYTQPVRYNPQGPSKGSYRVNRGGCWGSIPGYVRAASRNWRGPGFRCLDLGFRLLFLEGSR